MKLTSKICVLGSNGLVGSTIIRELKKQGYTNIIPISRKECDLTNAILVNALFKLNKFEYVFNVAGKVGGINSNNMHSADFIYENLMIVTNVIHACYKNDTIKMLYTGSSCIYPRDCPQPIKEDYFLSGPLEETNKAYAVAKIAGITMCEMYRKQYGCNFISVMPTNLYGVGDNYDLYSSHVLPALIRKFHEAKINNLSQVEAWGTGSPMREFLFVDDLAEALVFLMNNYSETHHINIGTGKDISIRELTELIKDIIGYKGKIFWNTKYPDGTPKKLLDVSKINNLGWKAKTNLKKGIKITYNNFLKNK